MHKSISSNPASSVLPILVFRAPAFVIIYLGRLLETVPERVRANKQSMLVADTAEIAIVEVQYKSCLNGLKINKLFHWLTFGARCFIQFSTHEAYFASGSIILDIPGHTILNCFSEPNFVGFILTLFSQL